MRMVTGMRTTLRAASGSLMRRISRLTARADVFQRLGGDGQAGTVQVRPVEVIETGEGYFPRYRHASFLQRAHRAQVHLVVAGDDGAGPVGQGQQRVHGQARRFDARFAARHQALVDCHAGRRQRPAVACQALAAGRVPLRPGQVADAGVAVSDVLTLGIINYGMTFLGVDSYFQLVIKGGIIIIVAVYFDMKKTASGE